MSLTNVTASAYDITRKKIPNSPLENNFYNIRAHVGAGVGEDGALTT